MKKTRKILWLIIGLFLLTGAVGFSDNSSDILDFLPAFIGKSKFGNAIATPFFILPGISNPVTISVYIPDSDLVLNSVKIYEITSDGKVTIGNLIESGNRVFSITTNFQKDSGVSIFLGILATIGSVNKTIARFDVPVLNIPAIQNFTQYNQNIDNILSTLCATRDNFIVLQDPLTSYKQFFDQLNIAKDRLQSVYAALESTYRAETHSPSNFAKWAAYKTKYGALVQSQQNILDARDLFIKNPYDPRVAEILSCAISQGLDIETHDDRELAAYLCQTHGEDAPFVKETLKEASKVAIKAETGQYTDLIGSGIGQYFEGMKGWLVSKGVNYGISKLIDIFFFKDTNEMGMIVAKVQDEENIQEPIGSHDVIYSFGGELQRAIGQNIPVTQNSPITVNIAPGEIKDYATWPMFQHDAQHTGRSPYQGPQTNAIKWAWPLPTSTQPIGPPVIAYDNTTYIVLGEAQIHRGILYAISSSGEYKWQTPSFEISGYCCWSGMVSTAVAANGIIFVGGPNKIMAYNPDGNLKWTFIPDGYFFNRGPNITLGNDGTLYASCACGTLGQAHGRIALALDQNGSQKWVYSALGNACQAGENSLALNQNNTIFMTSQNCYGTVGAMGGIDAVDATTGLFKWYKYFNCTQISSPSIALDGTILIDTNYELLGFNPSDGEEKMVFPTGTYGHTPVIANDGSIVINIIKSLDSSTIRSFYPNGGIKWSFPINTDTSANKPMQPVIDAEGTVYVGINNPSTLSATIYAIKPDGTLKWQYNFLTGGSKILSQPAISSNGGLLIVASEGTSSALYAFGQ